MPNESNDSIQSKPSADDAARMLMQDSNPESVCKMLEDVGDPQERYKIMLSVRDAAYAYSTPEKHIEFMLGSDENKGKLSYPQLAIGKLNSKIDGYPHLKPEARKVQVIDSVDFWNKKLLDSSCKHEQEKGSPEIPVAKLATQIESKKT